MEFKQVNLGLGGGALYQYQNRSQVQMMGYEIITPDLKL